MVSDVKGQISGEEEYIIKALLKQILITQNLQIDFNQQHYEFKSCLSFL